MSTVSNSTDIASVGENCHPDKLENRILQKLMSFTSSSDQLNYLIATLDNIHNSIMDNKLKNVCVGIVQTILYFYVSGTLNPDYTNEFISWVCKNKFKYWDYLLDKFMEQNPDALIEFLAPLFQAFKVIPTTIKLDHMTLMAKNQSFRSAIVKDIKLFFSSGVVHDGVKHENEGLFCWMRKIPWDMNVDDIYTAISPIIEDKETFSFVLKYLEILLKSSSRYAHDNITSIDTYKCPSFTFMVTLFRLLMKILSASPTYKNITVKEVTNPSRTNFILMSDDNNATMLLLVTLNCFCQLAQSQYKIYKRMSKETARIKNVEEILCHTFIENDKGVIERFNLIEGIITSELYQREIDNFMNFYFSLNINLNNNDIMNSLLHMLLSRDKDLPTYKNTSAYINALLIGLRTDALSNPSIRCNIADYMIRLLDTDGFYGKNVDIINSFMKYISDVDLSKILPPASEHDHYIACISLVSKITSVTRLSDFSKDQELNQKSLMTCIHKICYKAINFIDSMIKIDNSIKERQQNIGGRYPPFNARQMKTTNLPVVKVYMNALTLSLNSLVELISKLVGTKDIDALKNELIMPVVTLIVNILKYFSLGSNAIYSIFEMNMPAQEVMKLTLEIVDSIKQNKCFINEISSCLDMIKDMVKRVKLPPALKTSLESYFSSLKIEFEIPFDDYPPQYTDNLLLIPIRDPVMLPDMDDFFEKSSILSQLMQNKMNPYNRQPLTIEELDSYNESPEIKEKISKFTDELNKWKEEYMKKHNEKNTVVVSTPVPAIPVTGYPKLVLHYTEQCKFSQAILPEWQKLEDELKGKNIVLEKRNCTGQDSNVAGYPTIILEMSRLDKKELRTKPAVGGYDRTKEGILQFLTDHKLI